jgi:hypothetical protein
MADIVIDTLVTEYVKARHRVDGAQARIEFSKRQLEAERKLLRDFTLDRDRLAEAIGSLGGQLPPVDEPTPTE